MGPAVPPTSNLSTDQTEDCLWAPHVVLTPYISPLRLNFSAAYRVPIVPGYASKGAPSRAGSVHVHAGQTTPSAPSNLRFFLKRGRLLVVLLFYLFAIVSLAPPPLLQFSLGLPELAGFN